uniref:CID domain-containing protein n=1 Tax=Timema poppense TaxID=170557 RepID=A0A7R9HB20_TIMPO|nr:unnamed protein product [Timema poppensis]
MTRQKLSSLYDVKPPISKAKMTAITRGAIKAIKFYKHVVQSVEKFIQKCKPEYKVPGLYVIDSIVRQSRHQFGAEKDVFAPRFSKNLTQTFVNLFTCPPEEKSKVVRVLNLWQKNTVFQSEVIQPLFDLADPSNPLHQELAPVITSNGSITALNKTPPTSTNKSSSKQDTPVWLALAQSQIDAASNAVMQMSGQAGGPLPPAKPVGLVCGPSFWDVAPEPDLLEIEALPGTVGVVPFTVEAKTRRELETKSNAVLIGSNSCRKFKLSVVPAKMTYVLFREAL